MWPMQQTRKGRPPGPQHCNQSVAGAALLAPLHSRRFRPRRRRGRRRLGSGGNGCCQERPLLLRPPQLLPLGCIHADNCPPPLLQHSSLEQRAAHGQQLWLGGSTGGSGAGIAVAAAAGWAVAAEVGGAVHLDCQLAGGHRDVDCRHSMAQRSAAQHAQQAWVAGGCQVG